MTAATQAPGAYEPGAFVGVMYQLRLRSRTDRAHVARLYTKHFGGELGRGGPLSYALTPAWFHVGFVSLPRRPAAGRLRAGAPLILRGLLEAVQAVMMCVRMQWLCLVTGPAASGKTSLIRSGAPSSSAFRQSK